MEYINYSGGAQGADTCWKIVGKRYKVRTIDYVVEHMNALNQFQLKEVEDAYIQVTKQLLRPILHSSTYAGKLVRRNYLQAKAGYQILAIGNLVKGEVQGGTAYCVQYAINMQKPIWFFDQITDNWLYYDYTIYNWERCGIPCLLEKNTTVGTRELKPNGMKAIEDVYKKTFN